MSLICTSLAADVARDCDNPSTAEMEQKVLLIPSSALPQSGITYDATNPNELITDIATASGTQGYLIEGIQQKNWINRNTNYVNPADGSAGFLHSLEGIRILAPSLAARKAAHALLVSGDTFYAVVEKKWKGTSSAQAFEFLGAKFGLVVPDGGFVDNSNENDGAMVVSLSTREGLKEPYLPHIFLDTDYATTVTAVWTNKLATA
jgi:hypothetical protein